jgi:hypothetical protein
MSAAQAAANAQNAPQPPPLEDPAILNITFTTSTGKQVGSPIVIRVPRVLSKKLAKMCLAEMMGKLTKATLDKVVADLGW